ncbi:MAG: hypothetical protein VX737_05865 [Pseudomonadota bacterium]|nr:hypothetical protein [Pseudomonadota bacterium]
MINNTFQINSLANTVMAAISNATDTAMTYVENKPEVTTAVYFTAALAMSAVALSIYPSAKESKPNLEESKPTLGKDKAVHATKLNSVLEELKTQDLKKNSAAKKIQQFYRKNKKNKSTFQKLSQFIKNGVKSMMTAFSKFGKFVFKTLPSRMYAVVFRNSVQQKHSQQYSKVMFELEYNKAPGKAEHADNFKPVMTELKDTRKVKFDDEVKTAGLKPSPAAAA